VKRKDHDKQLLRTIKLSPEQFFFICIYYFQPVFYRLGMSRGIYTVFYFTRLHYICSFLTTLVVWSYFAVFNFPGAHLEVAGTVYAFALLNGRNPLRPCSCWRCWPQSPKILSFWRHS